MVYSLVVRARGLEYGGREFKSRSLHWKPETKLREERGLSGCRNGLKTVPLAQALLSLKPASIGQCPTPLDFRDAHFFLAVRINFMFSREL